MNLDSYLVKPKSDVIVKGRHSKIWNFLNAIECEPIPFRNE